MDFLIDLVVQVIVEIVMELLGRSLLNAAQKGLTAIVTGRAGRYVVGLVLGTGFGLWWGQHLSGQHTWPKLFWVSVSLGFAALVVAVARGDQGVEQPPTLRDLVVPPWRWSPIRLMGFAIINAGVALGIVITFGPGWVPAS